MRLLNAETLRLEEYYGEAIPQYAILSHRWHEEEEVLFSDVVAGDWTEAKKKLGFRKIEMCMKQTLEDGYQYFWIDTCCIDKSSSAELSEAINSMYSWYRQAQVCYAYLDDVLISDLSLSHGFYKPIIEQEFSSSVWWTRGWTLQELIAPSKVFFYSGDWKKIGTKHSLSSLIAKITGIDRNILQKGNVGDASVAQRMCWASKRKTTRIEDMAYCLMGIFELNMPLLYGEGEKAFIRLQEEIIRNVDDHSIFAWTSEEASQSVFRGLLAKSTSEFRDCSEMAAEGTTPGEPYFFTNRGLKIAFPMRPIQTKDGTPSMEFFARLNCTTYVYAPNIGRREFGIQIRLMEAQDTKGSSQYARVNCGSLLYVPNDASPEENLRDNIYVRQKIKLPRDFRSSRVGGIRFEGFEDPGIQSSAVWPHYLTKTMPSTIRLPNSLREDQPELSFIRILFTRYELYLNRYKTWKFPEHTSILIVIDCNAIMRLDSSDALQSADDIGKIYFVTSEYKIERVPTNFDCVNPYQTPGKHKTKRPSRHINIQEKTEWIPRPNPVPQPDNFPTPLSIPYEFSLINDELILNLDIWECFDQLKKNHMR